METEAQLFKASKINSDLKKGAKVALVLMLLNIIWQLANIYKTRYQLVSPLIPESFIWEISKEFVFHAMISAIASIIGLFLYFFEKYLWVIILVALIFILINLLNV